MDKQVEAFKELSAAAVSDALVRLGLHGACLGLSRLPWDPPGWWVGPLP